MTQQELLDKIKAHPGIEQSKVANNSGYGHDHTKLKALMRKGCVRRETAGRTYRLYWTGVEL